MTYRAMTARTIPALPPLDTDDYQIAELMPAAYRYVTAIRTLGCRGTYRVLSVHRTREAAERRAARCGDTVMLAWYGVRVGDVA